MIYDCYENHYLMNLMMKQQYGKPMNKILEVFTLDCFEGILLENRFHLLHKLNQGCFGEIFHIKDLKDPNSELIVKIQRSER